MTSHWRGVRGILYCTVMLQLLASTRGDLLTLVESIASFDNASDRTGTELGIFTTDNSTLNDVAPNLLPRLLASYPSTFLQHNDFVDVRTTRLASMVLLDVSAFEQKFPTNHVWLILNNHPCYTKTAKFVILVKESVFRERKSILALMAKVGILNFIVVLEEPGAAGSSLAVWTENQFTKREQYFRSDDRPVTRFFPNKLKDLHGYRFTLFGNTEFPYILPQLGESWYGMVVNFVNTVVRKVRNGTTGFTDDDKLGYVAESRFNEILHRRSFSHTLYFREPSGIYLVCPVHQERDFLHHLLKPFSAGIWLVLGALFVCCRMLQVLFPGVYRYDLFAITFFGGGGTEHEQPFPFRIVTFTLTVLVFFLSEAYNTKIISLMSLSKFYVQPQTLDELARSDFQILSIPRSMQLFEGMKLKFLPYAQTQREERRLGRRVHEVYCSMMNLGVARIVVATLLNGLRVRLYIVQQPLVVDRFVLQLAQHSPFFEMFQDYFNRYNDFGLWAHMLNDHLAALSLPFDDSKNDPFQEVIFFFDDLTCVWMLIVAGWLISAVAFIGELTWYKFQSKARSFIARK